MNRLGSYIFQICVGLLISQLFLENLINVIFGSVLLIAHIAIIFFYYKDYFLFTLYLFSLCIVGTYDKMGGIILAPLLILVIRLNQSYASFFVADRFVRICLFFLVVTSIFGYFLKHEGGGFEILQALVIFSGCILTFMFIQNLKFENTDFNILFKIFTFLSFLLFLVALNQKFVFIDSSLLLLGAVGFPNVSGLSYAYDGRIPSLLGQYELFSEFSLLMFILSFSIYMDKRTMEYFKFGNWPLILIFFSFLNVLVTGTRSSFLLLFAFLFVFYLIRIKVFFSHRTLLMVLVLVLLIPVFARYGNLVGLDIIGERLTEIGKVGVSDIKTGDQLNRAIVYERGYRRLAEENWLIGYGFGTYKGNDFAWGLSGMDSDILDFHSLYLSIPMIYGLIGGPLYLLLIVYIAFLLFKKYCSLTDSPFKSILIGFALLFIFFLVNEMKTNSLRLYYYHFLIWILLGLALSITKLDCVSADEPN
jgi:hypothetical protein